MSKNAERRVSCIVRDKYKSENGTEMECRYYDKNGKELFDGDYIKFNSTSKEQKLYATDQGLLGTAATNPKWIESGRACPCEYGIYPLENGDMKEIEFIHH